MSDGVKQTRRYEARIPFCVAALLALSGCSSSSDVLQSTDDPPAPGSFDCETVHVSTQADLDAAATARCTDVSHLSIGGEQLENVIGLETIAAVRYLEVYSSSLQSLEGLSGVRSVDRLIIRSARQLATLRGLDSLEDVTGYIQVHQSTIGSLEGLGSVRRGRLQFFDNDRLSSLEGLSSEFNHVDNELSVTNSPVRSLEGLGQLHTIGALYLEQMRITSLEGLGNLRTVGQGVAIRQNAQLESLNGLDSLRELPWLSIYYNDALTDLSGVARLTRTQELTISQNHALTTLGALHEWTPGTVWGKMTIHYNTSLPSCEVMRFFETQDPAQEECVYDCEGNAEVACQ